MAELKSTFIDGDLTVNGNVAQNGQRLLTVATVLTPSYLGASYIQTNSIFGNSISAVSFSLPAEKNGIYILTFSYNMIMFVLHNPTVDKIYHVAGLNRSHDPIVCSYHVNSNNTLYFYSTWDGSSLPSGYKAYLYRVRLY